MGEMSRTEKAVNLGAVVVPFAATLAAIVLLWNSLVSPADLVIAAVMYLLTAIGITVGFHRLLTHRSFQTSKPLEYTFAVLGSMAVQGPVIAWVADHRKHHAHTDEEGDPHSPHVGHGGGVQRSPRRPLARPHRLAAVDPGPRRLEALRARPLRGPGMRLISPPLPAPGPGQPGAPGARRLPGQRHPRRRRSPACSGAAWCGSSSSTTSPGASTRLSLLRQPPLRHRRSLDQRLLAGASLARRVLAPQPPRLPPLGRARPADAGSSIPRR